MNKIMKYVLYMDYKVEGREGWLPLVKEFMTEDEAVAFVSRIEFDKNVSEVRVREYFRVVTEKIEFPSVIQAEELGIVDPS